MYRLLIADDEYMIREGLKCLLDWQKLGFTEIEEATNGEQVLDKIRSFEPDLILLDIHMPKQSGLEVIEQARAEGYSGQVIIITGYSAFHYARQAIRFGVTEYLTKPIDETELLQIVQKICKELDNKATATRYRAYAKNSIIYNLLIGKADLSSLDLHDLHLSADVYQVVLCEPYNSQKNQENTYRFSDMLRLNNPDQNTFHDLTIGRQEVLLLKGKFAIQTFQHVLKKYRSRLIPEKNSPLDRIFLAYGRCVQTLSELPQSYSEANLILSRRFFCMEGQHTVGYESLPKLIGVKPILSKDLLNVYASQLLDAISSFRRQKVEEVLCDLQNQLFCASESVEQIRLFLTDLFLLIKERMNHLYGNTKIPFPGNSEIIKTIQQMNYLYEIIDFFISQIDLVISTIGTTSSDTVIEDVLQYMNHHYTHSIKLEAIAPLFGYNSSYLGKLFSKKVGENFNTHLDHIRIEQAKELLKNQDLKVYTVAENVGYSNVDYFHIKFKKFVGETPAEYRKKFIS